MPLPRRKMCLVKIAQNTMLDSVNKAFCKIFHQAFVWLEVIPHSKSDLKITSPSEHVFMLLFKISYSILSHVLSVRLIANKLVEQSSELKLPWPLCLKGHIGAFFGYRPHWLVKNDNVGLTALAILAKLHRNKAKRPFIVVRIFYLKFRNIDFVVLFNHFNIELKLLHRGLHALLTVLFRD